MRVAQDLEEVVAQERLAAPEVHLEHLHARQLVEQGPALVEVELARALAAEWRLRQPAPAGPPTGSGCSSGCRRR